MTIALAAPMLVAFALGAATDLRLDVKPGLWETKHTTSTKMQGDMPQRDLSRLSPEQRARVQESLERYASGKPHTVVRRSCVTQEDLDKGTGFDDREQPPDCERHYLDRTSRHVRFELSCAPKQGGMTMKGNFDVTVKSPELVAMNGDMKMNMPGRSSSTHMEMTGRRLGSSCGDIKPGESRTISK